MNQLWSLCWCVHSTGLKTAVKALTVSRWAGQQCLSHYWMMETLIAILAQARFGVSDTSEPSTILTKSIIDWAKPLCYTSCGNYLCQQLLERGTLEDRKSFLNQIRLVSAFMLYIKIRLPRHMKWWYRANCKQQIWNPRLMQSNQSEGARGRR